MEQCGGTVLVEQLNSDAGTVKVETCWGKTEVEEWNTVGGTGWWISGTVLVE